MALSEGLREFTDRLDPLISRPIDNWVGLHVYTLPLEKLEEGLSGARPAGWRFLTRGGVAADISESDAQGRSRMISFLRDPVLVRALEAVEQAGSLPEVQGSEYELRVLRIPGILTEAFWLVSAEGGPDLIVPVLTRSAELKRTNVYPAEEYLGIARSLAERFLEFDRIEKSP